jgi:class 3 adenylate cyclase/tetratricopeptide (TPR) repeat protein
VIAGRGQLVLLSGEPGIGKTRLADDLASFAAISRAKVSWGRCWESGGAPVFWPWIQVLRDCLNQACLNRLPAEIRPSLAYVASMLPELQSPLAMELGPAPEIPKPAAPGFVGPEPARFRLFDSITGLLKWVGSTNGLVIIIDDIHAADSDSLLLLRFLARGLRQSHLMIVATYRDEEVRQSQQLAALVAEIAREGHSIPLRGLSENEVTEFLTLNAGLAAEPALASSLHRVTEGNPFFLDEVVSLMLAEKARFHSGPGSSFVIPDGVRATIRRRLSPLSETGKAVLTVAAVMGREFELAPLGNASALPMEKLLDVLVEAEASGLVVQTQGGVGRYKFSHAMIPEVLTTDLRTTDLAQLHQRVAQAIEDFHHIDIEPHLARLAHHYTLAFPHGPLAKAVEYARRGADHARSKLAYVESGRLYGMALHALENAPNTELQRCELLLALGEVESKAGNRGEACKAFDLSSQIARRLGNADLLARAILGIAIWSGSPGLTNKELVALLKEALNSVGTGHSSLKAQLLARLAVELNRLEGRDKAISVVHEALEVARRVSDMEALIAARYSEHSLFWSPENVQERFATANEIVSLAEQAGRADWTLKALELRISALLELGDVLAVERDVEECKRLTQKSGERTGALERHRATLCLLRGNFVDAEKETQQLLAIGQWRQDPELLVTCAGQIAQLRGELGRLAELEPMMVESVSRFPGMIAARCGLLLFYTRSGRGLRAQQELDELAAGDFVTIPKNYNWLGSMAVIAEACATLEDTPRAATLYKFILPYGNRNVTLGWGDIAYGSAEYYLGLLATVMNNFDRAEAHFETALRFNTRMGAKPFVARTQASFAEMLLRRNLAEDGAKALTLAKASIEITDALGMETLREKARALKETAQTRTLPLTDATRARKDSEHRTCENVLDREGDYWKLTYEGSVTRIRDLKGLNYIARLLNHPGVRFHVLDLIAGSETLTTGDEDASFKLTLGEQKLTELGLRGSGIADAGEMLDAEAKAAYQKRYQELLGERDEAKKRGDPERITKAEGEIDAVAKELARGSGSSARGRRAVSAVEKARVNVTRAIKAALAGITEKNAALGRLLSSKIKTGTLCSYIPEVTLRLGAQAPIARTSESHGADTIGALAVSSVKELPELRAHAAPDGTVTILFSDVEGSTSIFDRLGDIRAQEILAAHNAIIREQVTLQKGFEVKSTGDGFMVAFSSARRALFCAIGIQRALTAYCQHRSDEPIRVRIGLHVGEVISESADFFGKAVILAARIAALARGGEILVSSIMHDLTENAGDLRFSEGRDVRFKGLSGSYRIYEAIWQ